MDALELHDIQAYIIYDYPTMHFSKYVMLKVIEPKMAKQWISSTIDEITTADLIHSEKSKTTRLNIAFTKTGLEALEMHKDNINAFSREFREGMVTEHRQRLLGDYGESDPKSWSWGTEKSHQPHLLLMVFGIDEPTCNVFYHKLKEGFEKSGLKEENNIDGHTLENHKEHFGFRDGISQPIIMGSGVHGPKNDLIQPGEFIMGYKNEYNVYPQSPLIEVEQGNVNLLAADAEDSGKKDLGRNSSYLVVRHIEQKVESFWNFMNNNTLEKDGSINPDSSIKLASQMFGRWPSGAPIVNFPEKDPGGVSNENDFGYAASDQDGRKCPFGSHIRRTNPRDSFEDSNPKESVKLSNLHRIIRRARLYGEQFSGTPLDCKPKGEVGMLFNCFNADISRQFEFIQYSWANSSKVKQLYDDPDPIIGAKENVDGKLVQNFTIQDTPVSKTVKGLERFITIKGGAYFFFPSITAVRYIGSL